MKLWETSKSLILVFLIIISLLLSWKLWHFQTDSQPQKDTNYIDSSVVDHGKRSFLDVVRPRKVIFKQNKQTIGLFSSKAIKKMFKKLIAADYKNVDQVYQNDNIDESPLQSEGISFIFPEAIPTTLFADLLKSADKSDTKASPFEALAYGSHFDRIKLFQTKGRDYNIKVYFMNGYSVVASADVTKLSFDTLMNYKDKSDYPLHLTNVNGQPLYLSTQPVDIEKVYYTSSWVPVQNFKEALFSDPHDVLEQRGYYTNGVNSLKISNHIIKFVTPHSKTQQNETVSIDSKAEMIIQSFGYVNSHSGWTDTYILYHYNRQFNQNGVVRGETVFRMLISQHKQAYPVYERVYGQYPYRDAGTILLKWENGSIHEYGRTLLNLDSAIRIEPNTELPAGLSVWQTLQKSEDVATNKVQNLQLGYAMDYTSNSGVVLFTPQWFVHYGKQGSASWMTVDSLITTAAEKKSTAKKSSQVQGRQMS